MAENEIKIMTTSDHVNENAFGIATTFRHYEAASDYYLICLHGAGEKGPIDGTELNEVEKHGYPKHAKNGYPFPFNIIAPQSMYDHRKLMQVLPVYIKEKFKAKVIIVTGLSLGGYGTYDAVLTDQFGLVYAVAPVCGSGRIESVSRYRNMIAWHFHGDLDPKVRLNTAKGFIDKYNAIHTSQIKLTVYEGVAHNAWDRAYSVEPGQDELLQWIIQQFNEAPKSSVVNLPVEIERFRNKTIEATVGAIKAVQ